LRQLAGHVGNGIEKREEGPPGHRDGKHTGTRPRKGGNPQLAESRASPVPPPESKESWPGSLQSNLESFHRGKRKVGCPSILVGKKRIVTDERGKNQKTPKQQ